MRRLHTPLDKKTLSRLNAGQEVLLTGTIFTARDQVHKKGLPPALKRAVIYYCGPNPSRKGRAVGSAGPTTSNRMDKFTPALLNKGLVAMIGKGRRSAEVKKAIRKNKAVYFAAPGGCGALLSTCIKKRKLIAYPELGPEAVYQLEVENFPLMVAIDAKGRDVYER